MTPVLKIIGFGGTALIILIVILAIIGAVTNSDSEGVTSNDSQTGAAQNASASQQEDVDGAEQIDGGGSQVANESRATNQAAEELDELLADYEAVLSDVMQCSVDLGALNTETLLIVAAIGRTVQRTPEEQELFTSVDALLFECRLFGDELATILHLYESDLRPALGPTEYAESRALGDLLVSTAQDMLNLIHGLN